MGYPTRLLGTDEEIHLTLRPHWKALVAPILVLLVTTALALILLRMTRPLWRDLEALKAATARVGESDDPNVLEAAAQCPMGAIAIYDLASGEQAA